MRSASTLVNPKSYMTAYNKGAADAIGKVYQNPYTHKIECEMHSGYSNGFHDNLKPDENGLIVRNAVTCGICQSPAHRYNNQFVCSKNPCHIGDLNIGIFDASI